MKCNFALFVCNKLLRQAFAIAKSGVEYNKEYKSPMPKFI
jgi:hypothetical protein